MIYLAMVGTGPSCELGEIAREVLLAVVEPIRPEIVTDDPHLR